MNDGNTKNLKAVEVEVVFLQIADLVCLVNFQQQLLQGTVQIFPPICAASPCKDLSCSQRKSSHTY